MSTVTAAALLSVSTTSYVVPLPLRLPFVAPATVKSEAATPVTDEPNVAVTVTVSRLVVAPLDSPSLNENATDGANTQRSTR